MKKIHYTLVPNRSAKQQVCLCLTKSYLERQNATILEEEGGDVYRLLCVIDPGYYRPLKAFMQNRDGMLFLHSS
jgi:hypothetical protein